MDNVPIVIDNGSYEIKFGTSKDEKPFRAINALARDKFGTSYLSNQIKGIKDISSVTFKRPHEFGQLTSWELQSCIWDYCFYNPDEFNGFGLKDTKGQNLVASETFMTIPELSKNMDQVVFEEYEFGSLFKSPSAGFIPFANIPGSTEVISGKGDKNDETIWASQDNSPNATEYEPFQIVIDSGFNCTWIVPVIKGVPYYKAIKKLDLGGRFLNGLLKETLSFRHYNVMDETILVNNIKEKCLFMSPISYFDSFKRKDATSVEYVLPDFQTSFLGYVRDPKQPLLEEAQTVKLRDELFSVPETFFHPEVAQLLKPGIIETIMESISMVPEAIRPLILSNVVCTGGNFNLPHFATRLATELQRQLPTDWSCRVHDPKSDCELYGWKAMTTFANTDSYVKARVTREEYYEHGVEWCTKNRFGYQNWI